VSETLPFTIIPNSLLNTAHFQDMPFHFTGSLMDANLQTFPVQAKVII